MEKYTLEGLIKDLRKKDEPDKIKEKLQEIGVKLLNEYVIEIDDIIIEPLLVEAYYYDKAKFKDDNTYGASCTECGEQQTNRYNKLFVHRPHHSAGIDIVLSNGDYCLSYLVKNSLVYYKDEPSEFRSQEKLIEKLSDLLEEKFSVAYIENKKDVLKEKRNYGKYGLKATDYEGLFTKRRGTSKGEYADMELACLLLEKIRDYKYSFGKFKAVAQYMFENKIEPTDDEIRKIIGSTSKEVKEYIKKLKNGEKI